MTLAQGREAEAGDRTAGIEQHDHSSTDFGRRLHSHRGGKEAKREKDDGGEAHTGLCVESSGEARRTP